MMTAKEIRESFKSFFESKEHLIVPSAPMVVKDDPTLMFTNAGMNQFKDIILGNRAPKSRRVADSQKCLRVSGKHNDLEEVGHDTYHHTMFEMLGNWSFGDYFKKEAISWAWEYLVDVLKLDPKNLYATVFEGSPEEGLERDNEAAAIWEQFLPKDHILNGNKHDNFWEMGDTGPCGPCSEIHMDSRSEAEKAQVPGRDLVNKDHPQVIEIWNLVFMQFNRKADHSLEPLPAKVIDTGMGFERLVRTLQGKQSNYDTDVFQPIIKQIGSLTGLEYGKDEKGDYIAFGRLYENYLSFRMNQISAGRYVAEAEGLVSRLEKDSEESNIGLKLYRVHLDRIAGRENAAAARLRALSDEEWMQGGTMTKAMYLYLKAERASEGKADLMEQLYVLCSEKDGRFVPALLLLELDLYTLRH